MPRILNPKDITDTTRFIFDIDLTLPMFTQLVKEFRDVEGNNRIMPTPFGVKIINYSNKRVLEVTKKFISFSPVLNSTEKEEFRKRIYRHVARKSDVYTRNAIESLDLAKRSLLTEELRSSASLLYYAYHNFFNGRLYKYLNNLDIEDFQVEINEMEHFTSSKFNKFVENYKPETEEITWGNHHDIFCTDRKKSANPYNLLKYLFIDSEDINEDSLTSYIEFLALNILSVDINNDIIAIQKLDEKIEEFKLMDKKDRTQEQEVIAAIIYSIKQSMEQENRLFWYVSIISLRLYWLRQTADYDYDFEIYTSVREMSLLLSGVNLIMKKVLTEELNFERDIIDKEKTLDIEYSKSVNVDDDATLNLLDKNELLIERDFPTEIEFDEKVSMFLIQIHLDPFFNKEKLIKALNFTPYISNQGKYFTYSVAQKAGMEINLHINDEGRWIIWFANEIFKNLNEYDLDECITYFVADLESSYRELFFEEIEYEFIASRPIFTYEKTLSTSSKGLLELSEDFQNRRNWIISQLKDKAISLFEYRRTQN